jgi:ADP-heptose:LPS heptosyltransferase
VKRILVLRTDRLGDVVLCSGYLAALAEAWPDAHIDVYLARETISARQILSPALHIHEVPFERHLRTSDETALRWLCDIEARNYDALIIPQFTLGYPEVLALAYSRIETRWGFANADPGFRPDWLGLRFGKGMRGRCSPSTRDSTS